ncbi:MAG: membrane dipeptidase, partial [Planctomycetaceae bacterium]
NIGEENRKVGTAPRQRTRFASLWPADDYKTTPSATQSLAWTNWPLFTVGLVQRGHSDEVIQKIIGGNVMRVARAALGG